MIIISNIKSSGTMSASQDRECDLKFCINCQSEFGINVIKVSKSYHETVIKSGITLIIRSIFISAECIKLTRH